jgi:hypothetical protein
MGKKQPLPWQAPAEIPREKVRIKTKKQGRKTKINVR